MKGGFTVKGESLVLPDTKQKFVVQYGTRTVLYRALISAEKGSGLVQGEALEQVDDAVPQAPTISNLTTEFNEGEGGFVGTVQWTSPDEDGEVVTLQKSGANANKFTLNVTTGDLSVDTTNIPGGTASYTVEIRTTDGLNVSQLPLTVTVNVKSQELIDFEAAQDRANDEAEAYGSDTLDITYTDPLIIESQLSVDGDTQDRMALDASNELYMEVQWLQSNDGLTWSDISGETSATLALTDAQRGQFISVRASSWQYSPLEYRTSAQYQGSAIRMPSNQLPTAVTFSQGQPSVNEGPLGVDTEWTLEATDLDTNQTHTFALAPAAQQTDADAAAKFSISGEILRLDTELEYSDLQEAGKVTLKIVVDDGQGATANLDLVINVVEDTPHEKIAFPANNLTFPEGGTEHKIVNIEPTDVESAVVVAMAGTSGHQDKFEIRPQVNADGPIPGKYELWKKAVDLDFETDPETYTIKITYSAGDSDNDIEQTLTLTMTDLNDEAPSDITMTPPVEIINGTRGMIELVASDEDAGTNLTFEVTGGSDEAKFEVVDNKHLRLKSAANYASQKAYEVEVTASDGENATMTGLTIPVVDRVTSIVVHALSVPQDRPEQFVVRLEHELGPQGYEILDVGDGPKFFLSDVSRLGIRSNATLVQGQPLSVTVRHVATQETETLSVAVTAPVGTGGGDGGGGGGGGGGGTASGDPYYQCLLLW